jgi:hypothetical protein
MSVAELETKSSPASASRRKTGVNASSLRSVVAAYAIGCGTLMFVMTVFLLPKNGFQLFSNAAYHQMMLKAAEVMGLAFITTLAWALLSSLPSRR